MRTNILIICTIALAMTGCGQQRGRFTTTGSQYGALLPAIACIEIVDGEEVEPSQNSIVGLQHLLYVVIVYPGAKQKTSEKASGNFDTYVTTLEHSWVTEDGLIKATIKWDRQADTVAIGKQRFNRKDGDVFILRMGANKEFIGQQLGRLGPRADFKEVLRYVREQQPEDKPISLLKLIDEPQK
jgi:hypothetical protein